ncbi:MAG TPA: hypothetical protein PKD52_00235 [Clostridiales bacterium]|nr:hypothetical protein [Clostridiales bacterium]
MVVFILVILYLFTLAVDFLPRRKERGKKETALYVSLLAVSFCVLMLYCFGVKIPSPHEPIEYVVEKIFMTSR